ncbi:preprotein translocase subunit YajC [bacterium]|nr:preprotein translocase subunit YajC [bacterium]
MAAVTGQTDGAPQGNPILSFLPFILIFVVFYFLFIRPQSKKQKEHDTMINSLQKGDRVITAGGLIGSVIGVADDIITLKFGENFKAEVGKTYISGKVGETNA